MAKFGEWQYTCDRAATVDAYRRATAGGSRTCKCAGCRNFVAAGMQVFPAAFLEVLESRRIDPIKDGEVYHMAPDSAGRHVYGGWYHFVGVLQMSGDFAAVKFGDGFSSHLCAATAPRIETLEGHPVVQLEFNTECLLWVTEWGVWPTSENLHLYHKLRQSHGDHRLLHEAPGHLFLRHEAPDLVSFLQVGILCGWDIHLLPTHGYSRAFLSHDEFVEFASDDNNPSLVSEFAAPLGKDGAPERA